MIDRCWPAAQGPALARRVRVGCGIATIAGSLAIVAGAHAQEGGVLRLEPVVVESARLIPDRRRTEEEERERIQRTPGGVEIVGEKTIQQSRGSNLQDVLEFVPGVLIRSRFGAADESQFSIRGSGLQNNFHQRGLNVLIDGFFYGNADGFSDFEALELRTTKRIEIYKGANALRFGANSIGGAVNLVTKTGSDAGLIEFEGNYGSFGFVKNYLGTGQVYGPFDLYVGLSNTELQGDRQWSEQSRWRAYGTGGYVLPGGTVLRIDLGVTNNQEQLPADRVSTGMSPSTTTSSGTRSRTSMSSRSPARPSPSRASRTSRARATPGSRWASTSCC